MDSQNETAPSIEVIDLEPSSPSEKTASHDSAIRNNFANEIAIDSNGSNVGRQIATRDLSIERNNQKRKRFASGESSNSNKKRSLDIYGSSEDVCSSLNIYGSSEDQESTSDDDEDDNSKTDSNSNSGK